jgi:starch phosphorylase
MQPNQRSQPDLLAHDRYLVLADFAMYRDCQAQVDQAWSSPDRWTRMSILNVARMGHFSADRAVLEYAERVWRVKPLPVNGPLGAGLRAPG